MQHYSDELSLSCGSNPIPGWACSINLSRGPLASFIPGQPTCTEVLFILHHAWITCPTRSFFHRKADIPANFNMQWGLPLFTSQQRSLSFDFCSLYVSLSLIIVCFEFNVPSELCFTCNVEFPVLPLQVEETAGNQMLCLSIQESITWALEDFSPHLARMLLIFHTQFLGLWLAIC